MTTINNLTIEQMREIVEGAPEWAIWWCVEKKKFLDFIPCSKCLVVEDLRTAISEHDSREFKVGDLVCFNDSRIMFPDGETKTNELFRVIRSDGLEIDLTEIGYSKIYKTWVGDLRHATPEEIKAGHRLEAERHG